jgi:hypothetical protein
MINQIYKLYFQNLYAIMILFSITYISLIGCKKTNEIELKPAPVGGDFTLQSKTGNYSLTQSRGKVVLIYFGFTSCPDVCPTTLSILHRHSKDLILKKLRKCKHCLSPLIPKETNWIDSKNTQPSFIRKSLLSQALSKNYNE